MSVGSLNNTPTSTPKSVRFQLNYNLRTLFHSYAIENDRNSYEDFLCHIRGLGKEIRDDDLIQILKEARGCISILNTKFKLFVELILIYQWAHRSDELVQEFQGFLQDLCSAHCDYTRIVIDHLVSYFKQGVGEWEEGLPSETALHCYRNLHEVIKAILHGVPLSRSFLITSIRKNFPYLKRPLNEQQSYVFNLLQVTLYEESLRFEILSIIIDKLLTLDCLTTREELEALFDKDDSMDVDDEIFEMDSTSVAEVGRDKSKSQISETLDACLFQMYKYLWANTHDSSGKLINERITPLYKDIIAIFDTVVLRTHKSNHVQFIVFYLLSLRPTLGQVWIQALWKMVSSVHLPPVIRQAAVSYIASFITRAKYLPLIVVQETLSEMSNWLHSYINSEDSPTSTPLSDLKVHGVFYTTCQALFYIIAFMHKELVHGKGLNHLQSLGLSKIITSRLNPLRVCYPDVVTNFSSIARSYQLAYCNAIIERNARATLPTIHRDSSTSLSGVSQAHLEPFFPFDPYLLPSSKKLITPIYREYSGPCEKEESNTRQEPSKDDDDDDFLDSSIVQQAEHQSALDMFSYSTSPGFIHFL